ncbi:hypothetical protein [Micromonospora pisi]|uniref:hypothetical protein n=1 Tax=Micromonospora pisi TaxID=589240 RepID=UPI0011C413DF|nr:hypothetical protein [Micromonospora pisi]
MDTGSRPAMPHALDGVDLTVAEGTIFSLLGPTAREKRNLSTFVPADDGAIRVVEHDLTTEPATARAAIGATDPSGACATASQRYYLLVVDITR